MGPVTTRLVCSDVFLSHDNGHSIVTVELETIRRFVRITVESIHMRWVNSKFTLPVCDTDHHEHFIRLNISINS